MKQIKGLVLAGGGVLGTAHLGAVKILEEYGYKFDYFVGSSIGAFIATVLACRCPSNQFEELIKDLDYSKITSGTNIIFELKDLYQHKGLHSTDNLRKMYSEVVKKITGNENITFIEVYTKYGTHLAMTATLLSNKSTVYFDHLTSPNMSVVDACIHSATVPFLFESTQYVDGGLLDNYPIKYLTKLIPIESIIGLNFFKDQQDQEINNDQSFYNFSCEIFSMLFQQAFKLHLTKSEKNQTIWINTFDIGSFNFNLSQQQKTSLFEYGMNAVKESQFK